MPTLKKTWIVGLAGACLLMMLAATLFWLNRPHAATSAPKIAILSSIPLQWGDSDIGAIVRNTGEPDPLVQRLSQMGQLIFVDSVEQIQARKPDIALLIQPRALSPDEMVRLDKWVRAGGRLLLFADPALQWPSEKPFGNPDRPLFTSMLSPLFNHWGLELAFPMDGEGTVVDADLSAMQVKLASPGIWQRTDANKSDGNCRIDRGGYLAECRPGKGQAVLIADADILEVSLWQSTIPGVDSSDNLKWLQWSLHRLSAGEKVVGAIGD